MFRQISVSVDTSWTPGGRERDAYRMGTFAAIDFETATAERSSACAVGLLVVDDWTAVDSRSWLIQPPGNRYDAFNTMIHGLSASLTADSPSFAEVWPEVESSINGRLVAAHNTAFDMSVLRRSAGVTGLELAEMRFACTYRLARSTWPDKWSYKLNNLADDFDIELDHHDALSDASAAGELVAHICHAHGVGSLEEVAEILGYRIGWLRPGEYGSFSNARKSTRTTTKIGDFESSRDEIDPDNPLFGSVVVFTGTLDSMTRTEAAQAAVDCGAKAATSVSKKADFLVVGVTDFAVVKDGSSSKMRKAIELAEAGHRVEIIDEADFLRLLNS